MIIFDSMLEIDLSFPKNNFLYNAIGAIAKTSQCKDIDPMVKTPKHKSVHSGFFMEAVLIFLKVMKEPVLNIFARNFSQQLCACFFLNLYWSKCLYFM